MSHPAYQAYHVHLWQPQPSLHEAEIEAEQMERQYRFFCDLKSRCLPEESQRVEHYVMDARRQMMDANSYLVAFRRRGYHHAVQEILGPRALVENDPAVPVGENLSLFAAPTVRDSERRLASAWSTTSSR